ncbi:MAG: methyltransferase [Phycisphaeraceae bacterium]|nr:methyltransferase [Phycisphaeraceae bacterium]
MPHTVSSRTVVRDALNHRQPARVPMDFGSTAVTGMHCSCVAALRDHFGLEKRPVKVHEPYQMLGLIEDDLLRALGVDVDGVHGNKTIFGFANEQWKHWRTPWGQEVLVSTDFVTNTDPATGDIYIHPQGDATAPASGHMPYDGYFFDAIVRQEPIDEDNLDPADNLEEFGLLSPQDLSRILQALQQVQGNARARVMGIPGAGLGDIALVPATFLKHPRGIRDITEWYVSLSMRQDYVHQVFGKQTDIALENLRTLHDAIGESIDVAFICGTDFGTQTSQFCSAATFRELWKPYYQRINNWIHSHTQWKTMKHSCGAVEVFINDFIESGFDILNPVQCSATGMEAEHIKKTYGDRIVFWGGGVDTQKVLPFGTPEEVRQQVLHRCQVFNKNGGFVFDAIHNVQARTPVANIVAMIDAVHEFNGVKR